MSTNSYCFKNWTGFPENEKTTETITFDNAVGENQNLTHLRAMYRWIPT